MHIRTATDQDQSAWDKYVRGHAEGTLFHLTNWQRVIEQAFGHKSFYLMAESDTRVVGVLPLFQIRSRLFGHFLTSVPFAELGGPLTDSEDVTKELLEQAKRIGEDLSCDYVELKNQRAVPNLLTKDLYYNFSKELLSDPEENLLAIPRKSRAAVRKGIKEGLAAAFGNDQFPDFYELMARSYHQLGTPIFPKSFFQKFLELFQDDVELMVVRTKDGEPISCVMSFYYKDRVMPFYAGSLWEYRQLCPNDFKYWELMKRACERGYKIFDYGRSKVDTGSFSFKKHWGFEPEPLAYQYQLIGVSALPDLSPANPKYQKKIEIWRRMPFPLTKILGPPLAKYLG